MKFIKVIKAEDNNFKYCSDKLKQRLNELDLSIKNKRSDIENRYLNYNNKELQEEYDSFVHDKEYIENYLEEKNKAIENATKNIQSIAAAIIDSIKIQTHKGTVPLTSANISLGLEDIETKQDIINQVVDALNKNLK